MKDFQILYVSKILIYLSPIFFSRAWIERGPKNPFSGENMNRLPPIIKMFDYLIYIGVFVSMFQDFTWWRAILLYLACIFLSALIITRGISNLFNNRKSLLIISIYLKYIMLVLILLDIFWY